MTLYDGLVGFALLLYVSAAVGYHIHLFTGSIGARRTAVALAPAGALFHFAAIGVWCTRHTGIFSDPGMPYSLVAFFLALGQVLANFVPRWSAVGSLSLPLAFVALSYAGVQQGPGGLESAGGTALLRPHVLVLLLGFCALALAFCLAVIYQLQSRLLKAKDVSGMFSRLPPLDSVANWAHWLAIIGFSMLTLGVITGTMAAPHALGAQWYSSPRLLPGLITSLVAWVIYAAYLGVSLGLGWRGRRTTYFLIAGFAVVLLAFFVSVGRHKGG